MFKKRSFFEKLTGGLSLRDYDEDILDDEDDFEQEEEFETKKESRKVPVTKEKELAFC